MTAPTPWSRFVLPWQFAPSATGAASPGDKLYFYVSGTSTPLDTFTDPQLSNPNENPVVADENGLWGDIFQKSQSYKVVWTDKDGNEKATADPVSPFVATPSQSVTFVVAEMTVDGNGGVPASGICGDAYVPVACVITASILQATTPGDLVLDVWADAFVTNTPPTQTDSIVASAPPTLGSSQSSIDTTLPGWSVTLPAGAAIRWSITSINSITRFTHTLVARPV